MNVRSLLLVALWLPFAAGAQTNTSSSEIYLGLRKLNVLGSVLYIAAHPDDENTRLLTYFAKDRMYRTGYLSLTRGDGGQNLIGDEQGIELGLIRTQELLAARRIDGAEQFFTRAFDFGFSKTPEETFTKWNREKILGDVVWVIRKFQPDLIISRFPTTGEGGHGHHTASAILANEAFDAAADPKRFPEQLKYVTTWQAKRIVWNSFNFGGNNTTSNDQFKMDVGGYNPVLGRSYGEIAADSRSQHKSQGFGVPRTRGEAIEFFKHTGGENFSSDLMDGVNAGWARVPGGEEILRQVNELIAGYDFLAPQASVPGLVKLYSSLRAMPAGYWRNQKLAELEGLLEKASGIWVEAFTTEPHVAQNDSVRISIAVNNRSGSNIQLKSLSVAGFDTSFNRAMEKNKNLVFVKTILPSNTLPVTQPFWLAEKMKEGYYEIGNQELIGLPDVQPAISAGFRVSIEGETFQFNKAVRFKQVDPVKGEVYQPFVVLPAVTFQDFNPVHFSTGKSMPSVTITAQTAIAKAGQPTAGTGRLISGDSIPLVVAAAGMNKGEQKTTTFSILPGGSRVHPVFYQTGGQNVQGQILRTIRYDHIPHQYYFKPAILEVKDLKLETRGRRIGYITGAGDKVPEALEQMGYEVTMLGDKELSRNHLNNFDAIISGVRAYNTAAWLNNHHEKLMKYVAQGGNLIVQYNTSNQIGPVRAKIGPYPFNISRNRITNENAAVEFLVPRHPVLNFPNKITAADFDGWIQERSIYHAAGFDSSFVPILSMADPGEPADKGSLVIAKYGRGFFTYTGLVFFRELPAGVTGAYRLMANLIALNQKKEL